MICVNLLTPNAEFQYGESLHHGGFYFRQTHYSFRKNVMLFLVTLLHKLSEKFKLRSSRKLGWYECHLLTNLLPAGCKQLISVS